MFFAVKNAPSFFIFNEGARQRRRNRRMLSFEAETAARENSPELGSGEE